MPTQSVQLVASDPAAEDADPDLLMFQLDSAMADDAFVMDSIKLEEGGTCDPDTGYVFSCIPSSDEKLKKDCLRGRPSGAHRRSSRQPDSCRPTAALLGLGDRPRGSMPGCYTDRVAH